ncbi:SDR family oxidoreductase [Sphingomonas sp.]|uniref:SDR family oxidoreductase n=1 Tax=Sphingomonas sp. TaxID=28214 RepID=UPI003B3AD6BD
MTIAVTGASGHLGRLALKSFAARAPGAPGARPIALARDPAKLSDPSVETRSFDYDRPDALAVSLAGVETLVLISSSEVGKRIAQHRAVIAAAKAAGVGRILYTSLLHADVSPLSLAQEHLATEADLAASGLRFTILRNGWYSENYVGSIHAALHHGALIGSAGEGRISSAARADYADALAVVAAGDAHDGKTYELAGDTAWKMADLAAEISHQAGRDIPYRNLPEQDYAAVLISAGLPEGLAHAVAGWDAGAAKDALFDDGHQLSSLIGHPTTSLSVTVAQAVQDA